MFSLVRLFAVDIMQYFYVRQTGRKGKDEDDDDKKEKKKKK